MSEPSKAIRKAIIVGGGTAGWMTATALAKSFAKILDEIVLIESADIGIVGVGEASIPPIKIFNRHIGIDEKLFMRKTQATFKLGIEFVDWKQPGEKYFHPFGPYGIDMNGVSFHAFWQRLQAAGSIDVLDDYNVMAIAARYNRFMHPAKQANSPLSGIGFAYHFDAALYAGFLRECAEKQGVKRIEGKIVDVKQCAETGYINSVILEDGRESEADIFIDCSGFYGVLIDKVLKVPFVDWSKYLPCDRAWAVATAKTAEQAPFTRSTARDAGWQWRIPLQHRTGNGIVFSSAHMQEQQAQDTLLRNIEGDVLTEPRLLRFMAGHRERFWVKNCVAIGLSSGFLEPLESTSIHLIQSGISRLLRLFPDRDFEPADIDEYNRQAIVEIEQIRDFLICHYKVTLRENTSFWQYCRNMEVPDSLARKIRLFESRGRIFRENEELFNRYSWLAVMVGQGLESRGFDANALIFDDADLERRMRDIKKTLLAAVQSMPHHAEYIKDYCPAN